MPLLNALFSEHKEQLRGLIHNTGGAHTKVKKFAPGTRIIKDNLLPVPPLFDLIQTESGTADHEMYQVFNMGTRLECYTDEKTAPELISISREFGIDAQIIGRVEVGDGVVEVHAKGAVHSY